MKLSTHFTLNELTKSQVATRLGIDNTPDDFAIEALEDLCKTILEPCRKFFGIPFSPSSGFRSADLCTAIGSKPTSQHAYGEAVDFEIPTVSNKELALWIQQHLDYDQLILEHHVKGDPNSGWVHCSISTVGDGRREALTYDRVNGYTLGLGD